MISSRNVDLRSEISEPEFHIWNFIFSDIFVREFSNRNFEFWNDVAICIFSRIDVQDESLEKPGGIGTSTTIGLFVGM